MVKFIGTVNVGGIKTETPHAELAQKEFQKQFGITWNSEKYCVVFVPTKMLGSATYALFQIRE